MRYANWDVILFPRDSLVPIQEFRTGCYVGSDENGRQVPTLTCYITSLPTSTPFRVSIHSWVAPIKPSPLIESRRKTNQRVVYTAQVIVDGARVFHGFYELASRWPQEILYEKRSITHAEHQTSHRGPFLEFPPFHQNVLMQRTWDARHHDGRIKVLLSEQLIRKTNSAGEMDLGASEDIVCFAFQHSPRDILEQAGISWPICNPLFLPAAANARPLSSQLPQPIVKSRDQVSEARVQSPLPHQPPNPFVRPHNPEPHARPKTDPPAQPSQFPQPPVGGFRGPRAGVWDTSLVFGDTLDDMSMDTWSTKRTSSNSTADVSMADFMYASPSFAKPRHPWDSSTTQFEREYSNDGSQARHDRKARQVLVTLRDDQLGQLIEAISPPKKGRDRDASASQPEQGQGQSTQTNTQPPPPRMSGIPVSTRPSAAALARSASYTEFNPHLRNMPNKLSPDKQEFREVMQKPPAMYQPSVSSNKENRPLSRQDSRLPTPYPFANRVPTPHPFVPGWGPSSDVSMRDPSSVFSSLSRFERAQPPLAEGKSSPAAVPSAGGSVKSRKEGLGATNSPAATPDHGIRHDKSLLPELDITGAMKDHDKVPHNTPTTNTTSPQIQHIEDILNSNPTFDNKSYIPGHKGAMSSMDSTDRKLFSALGEDLGNSFEADMGTGNLGSGGLGPTLLGSGVEDFESPMVKRKRQGTFGADRGRSPMAKKVGVEGEKEEQMASMRGG